MANENLTSQLKETLFLGIDTLAASGKLDQITMHLLSHSCGLPEARLMRSIDTLTALIQAWADNRSLQLFKLLNQVVPGRHGLLTLMESLVTQRSLIGVWLTLPQSFQNSTITDRLVQCHERLLVLLAALKEKPIDRTVDELASEMIDFLRKYLYKPIPDIQFEIAQIKGHLPWEKKYELFPEKGLVDRLALNESGFVFDPVGGRSFSANESAVFILKLLQQKNKMTQIVDAVTKEFDVTPSLAERDILEFASRLRGVFQ